MKKLIAVKIEYSKMVSVIMSIFLLMVAAISLWIAISFALSYIGFTVMAVVCFLISIYEILQNSGLPNERIFQLDDVLIIHGKKKDTEIKIEDIHEINCKHLRTKYHKVADGHLTICFNDDKIHVKYLKDVAAVKLVIINLMTAYRYMDDLIAPNVIGSDESTD